MKFKVIAPDGANIDGKLQPKGSIIHGDRRTARITTPLHFKQIEEMKEKAEDPEAAAKEAAAKGKEEAKAEAAAKK